LNIAKKKQKFLSHQPKQELNFFSKNFKNSRHPTKPPKSQHHTPNPFHLPQIFHTPHGKKTKTISLKFMQENLLAFFYIPSIPLTHKTASCENYCSCVAFVTLQFQCRYFFVKLSEKIERIICFYAVD